MISLAVTGSMAMKCLPLFHFGASDDVRKHGGIASSRGLQLKNNAHEHKHAKKQWMRYGSITKGPGVVSDDDNFLFGRTLEEENIFRQIIFIKSYEIGADRNATTETLMNQFQETALNHVKHVGLLSDDFGSTPEMSKKNLFWVVTKMQVLVARYPTWGDAVQVDTWVAASGKNGMRRDWMICDCKTGEILTRASSNWVMMNKTTRRLSKIPDEVRAEIERYFVDTPPLVEDGDRKLPKLDESTADLVRNGLKPNWSDLDVNKHVNNVKYVGWILEGTPQPILENYELARMKLEYRRECKLGSVLQSLTSSVDNDNDNGGSDELNHVDFQHLLRFKEGGGEVLKGTTTWRPKYKNLS